MSLRKSSSSRNGSNSEVLPKPNARRKCTPAPSRVGLASIIRLIGRIDIISLTFRTVFADSFLDGFGVDFEFDLFTHGHYARFQKFIVIDSVILPIQFGFRLQPDSHSAPRVFGGLRHLRW